MVERGHEEVGHRGAGRLYGGVPLLCLFVEMIVAADDEVGIGLDTCYPSEHVLIVEAVA